MTLPPPPENWNIDRITTERMQAVAAFGLTDRQARFLVNVMIHAGVFVERQYCAFAGIAHGQKTHDFLQKLIERRYATPIPVGPLHRGRLFHVGYKPLYAAIGQTDNRHRKPTSLGRMVERLMVLDAVLADRAFTWLGTEQDKRSYFMRRVGERVKLAEFPHLRFGDGPTSTVRYFPDKLPIGIQPDRTDHVFLYLVTSPVPIDFRLFLLRHAEILRALYRWTIRVLFPRPFAKAIPLFQHAARDHLATPLPPAAVQALEWFFAERGRRQNAASPARDERFVSASRAYRAPRFRALYRQWLEEGNPALWAAGSAVLRDALARDEGRVEFVELTYQYLHLSPLVGVA